MGSFPRFARTYYLGFAGTLKNLYYWVLGRLGHIHTNDILDLGCPPQPVCTTKSRPCIFTICMGSVPSPPKDLLLRILL